MPASFKTKAKFKTLKGMDCVWRCWEGTHNTSSQNLRMGYYLWGSQNIVLILESGESASGVLQNPTFAKWQACLLD